MLNKLKTYFGPSTLIAAAFIGPGTITVCTLSGVANGYSLLWALLFSTVSTIVLQEMSLRLGIVTGSGLGEAVRQYLPPGIVQIIFSIIVFSAIIIGNAAYEAGNISGAVLGLEIFYMTKLWPIILGIIAFILLFFGKYKYIESFLISLVITMCICFLFTVISLQPSISEVAKGFLPRENSSIDFLTVMAIVGTTVVPYNLFLHASIISKKYKSRKDLQQARTENTIAIALGGLISILIMIVSASALYGKEIEISNASDMAVQLEPILGSYAKNLFGIGLLAAGLSSAITAPLAAAYTAKGLFNWSENSIQFKIVWGVILVVGVAFSSTGFKFISIIKFAQIANGLLLPIIALYLIYLCNQKEILGRFTNTLKRNVSGILVIGICLLLSIKTFKIIFGF